MRWQLILEEPRTELIYNRGFKIILADALSCLDKIDYSNNTNCNFNKVEPTLESLSEKML